MESFAKTLALLFLASAALADVQTGLVPMPKLRPEDPARFFPTAVRLDQTEMAEVAALFRKIGREDLAFQAEKSRALRAVPPDAAVLTALLGVASERVREWALRGLGEHSGDKSVATPALLAIACDPGKDENSRALAARVLGTTAMDPPTVAKLAEQIGTGSRELNALLLEIVGGAGDAARPSLDAIKRHLHAPEVIVQYYAYQAIRKLDGNEGPAPAPYAAAQQLEQAQVQSQSDVLPRSLAVLDDPSSPGYLRSVALQALLQRPADPNALRAVVTSVGDPDLFISELAANVLRRMDRGASSNAAVLAESLSVNDARVRINSAIALRRLGKNALPAVPSIARLMQRAARGEVGLRETGICLDVLRAQGTNAASASAAVAALLPEQSAVYRNVEKHEVDRFRGFLFATLAETGVPRQAVPFVADALANSDEQMSYGFAGATRAAATLGESAASLIPYLVRPLENNTPQDFLDFEEFEAHAATTGEYTTCQIESLRALRRIGAPARDALPVVRAFHALAVDWIVNPGGPRRIPRVSGEAQQTLSALESTRTAQLQSPNE